MANWTPDDVRRIMTNPFYCINIAEELCSDHELIVSEEQWIAAAKKLIAQEGAETFLRQLLENLKGNFESSEPGDQHLNN